MYARISRRWMRQEIYIRSRRRLKGWILLFVIGALCCSVGELPTLLAQTNGHWTVEGVLGMMDKSAQDFHTLTADIEHVKYTAVVKDTSTETGHIFVRRDEKMRIEIEKPDLRTILRTGDSLFIRSEEHTSELQSLAY